MAVLDLLREQRGALKEKWRESIFRTYPLDTVGFLRSTGNEFTNPVGHRTTQAINGIIDALLADTLGADEVKEYVDDIVRVRAIQGFTPAKAVGVFFLLKALVRELLSKEMKEAAIVRELLLFETKLDSLALMAFDIYGQCRELLFEQRVLEVKNSQRSLLRRARILCDMPAEEPDTHI
jgi:hypothetical protein